MASGYEPPARGFRTFLIVWGTQSLSLFGSALTFFAITVWLTQVRYPDPEQKPELAAALSIVALAYALPTVFVAPLAGAWADRHDRRRTMAAADVGSALLATALAILVATETLDLWMLVIAMVVGSTLQAFHSSAFDTSYAMLVRQDQLPRANGMMQTMYALSGVLSPALAATIIALPTLARQGLVPGPLGVQLAGLSSGTMLAMVVDAVTFLFAAVVLLFLEIPSPRREDMQATVGRRRPSIWADVRTGARYILDRRPLLWLLGTFTVANFVASPAGVLQPLLVKFSLAEDWMARGYTYETALAFLGSVFGLGGVAGGFLISSWGGLKSRRIRGILLPMMLASGAQIIYGLTGSLYVAAGMTALFASTTPLMNAHSQAIWQTQTPHELQGRVFAVRRLIAQFTWPLSTAIAGWAGGLFNPGHVIATLGVLQAVFVVAQMFNPTLLRVEDRDWLESLAAHAAAERA